ncbi:MAG: glycosyltransferase [Rhodothalassiaceae bacterium]
MPVESNTAVILVNYCGASDTLACIDSLLAGTPPPAAILITDNASPRQGGAALATGLAARDLPVLRLTAAQAETAQSSRDRAALVLIDNDRNAGFGAACNLAMRAVKRLFGDLNYWMLNNDCTVAPDCLAQLEATAIGQGPCALIGATMLLADQPGHLQSRGGGRLWPWLATERLLGYGQPDDDRLEAPQDRLDYITGGSLYLPAPVYRRIGGFDERFFLYLEDVDLSLRARRAGIALIWCKPARVWHRYGASTNRSSAFVDYHALYGSVLVARRYFPYRSPVSTLLLLTLKLVNRLRRGQAERLPALMRAFWTAWRVRL